jgi:hypothetical protein
VKTEGHEIKKNLRRKENTAAENEKSEKQRQKNERKERVFGKIKTDNTVRKGIHTARTGLFFFFFSPPENKILINCTQFIEDQLRQ